MNRQSRCFIGLAATLLLLSAGATATEKASDASSIRALISTTYDQPDAKVHTDPVIVVGEHAVADWIQGKRGGRALLVREQGQWQVVLCAGDGLKYAETMVQAGIPSDTAKTLAQKLSQAEKPLPASLLRQFGLFGTSHDPATGHHAEHPAHAPPHSDQKH